MLDDSQRNKIRYAAGHLVWAESDEAVSDAHSGDSADLAWDIFEELFATKRKMDQDFGGPLHQNEAGDWVPVIPMPSTTRFGRPICEHISHSGRRCGKKLWDMRQYEEHFALEHIVRGR